MQEYPSLMWQVFNFVILNYKPDLYIRPTVYKPERKTARVQAH